MLAREQIRQLKQDDGRLVIDWADEHHSVFHYIWLRDNCLCPHCRHSNGQRLLDTAAIPAGIVPARLSQTPNQAVEIEWADGHRSQYEPAWLRAHCYSAAARAERHRPPSLWGAEIAGNLRGPNMPPSPAKRAHCAIGWPLSTGMALPCCAASQ